MNDNLLWYEAIFRMDRTEGQARWQWPPRTFFSERDLWWASLGQNVGSEMNGKSGRFSRPVLIIKKLAHGFYLVAPTTTQKREGSWYVYVQFESQDEYVCLNQIRTIDYRRLHSKLGQIDTDNFAKVKEGFQKLYL